MIVVNGLNWNRTAVTVSHSITRHLLFSVAIPLGTASSCFSANLSQPVSHQDASAFRPFSIDFQIYQTGSISGRLRSQNSLPVRLWYWALARAACPFNGILRGRSPGSANCPNGQIAEATKSQMAKSQTQTIDGQQAKCFLSPLIDAAGFDSDPDLYGRLADNLSIARPALLR